WDPYHEGTRLRDSVEKYKERHGYYPEAVLVDTIYRTRENRKFCKERGIRMSGPKLGRPSKNEQVNVAQKRVERDRKSTRLNSSHVSISYAVFCLKQKRQRKASD